MLRNSHLVEAIEYYKSKDGKLNGKDVPLMCLFPHEREKVYDEDSKLTGISHLIIS